MGVELPEGMRERVDALDQNLREQIEARAFALWEADGRPEGRALDYWLAAEQEIVNQSSAGEEDPLAALDAMEPGALAADPKR